MTELSQSAIIMGFFRKGGFMSKEFMTDGSQYSPEVFQAPNTGTEGSGGGKDSGNKDPLNPEGANPSGGGDSDKTPDRPAPGGGNPGEMDELRRDIVAAKAQAAEAVRVAREAKEETERERAARVAAEARAEKTRELPRYFFPKDVSDDNAWEILEEQIRVEEREPGKFDENVGSQLLQAITSELAGRGELQVALRDMLRSRYTYKNLGYALGEGAVDLYADTIIGMGGKDHEIILSLGGMDQSLDALDNATFWRTKDAQLSPEKKLELLRGIFGDNPEGRRFAKKFGTPDALFRPERLLALCKADQFFLVGIDKLKPEDRDKIDASLSLAEKIFIDSILALPDDDPKKIAARKIVDRVSRNIALGEVAYNLTGQSAELDGLVDKAGNPIFLDRVILKYGRDTINLADPQVHNPSTDQGKVLEKVRKEKPYLIGMAWDRAWRQLYQDRWDDIDFKNSLQGRAPLLIKGRQQNPIRYMRTEESKPGEPGTEPLKKATYVGVLPLITLSMRGSVKEQLKSWGGDFGFRLAASLRIKGGDKVRKMFNEEGPRLLYNPEAISNFDQSLKDFKEAFSYLPAEEQHEQMAYLIEHLAVFSMDDLKKVFHYENQSSFAVDNRLRVSRDRNLINKEQEEILKNNVIVRNRVLSKIPVLNNMIKWFKVSASGLNHVGAIWEMIKAFFKQAFSLK
ncbi:MAG: hypothetical protein UU73_C0002G0101 [Candidatus Daviesbacteria bacterium GW2011_GWA1_41_61]|nr:MAG: hypothetical protein UU44_C0001G0101 [Candidatus Daviesbacteria bacterium GW2011_GWB1_41_15]KKS15227.1 MAG: hypothetical protein UU73_C0002G0101 [Candidatus Daviesbacteria bacterium GW2011_GWA1_41_61]